MRRRRGGLSGGDDLQVAATEARAHYNVAIEQGEAALHATKAEAIAPACRTATAALAAARYGHGWVVATAKARGIPLNTDPDRPKRAEAAVLACWDHAVQTALRAASWEATKTRW